MRKGRTCMHNATRGLMLVLMGLMTCLTIEAQKKHRPVDDVEVQPVFRMQLSENDAKRFNYFFLEAVRQQQKENYAAAFDLFKHCLDIDPQAPEVHFALANLYRRCQPAAGNSFSRRSHQNVLDPSPDTLLD